MLPATPSAAFTACSYAFVGFGALGRQIAGLFLTAEEYAEAIFFDDALFAVGVPRSRPFADHIREEPARHRWIVGLGYKHLQHKERLTEDLLAAGCKLPVLIHERAHVHRTAKLEPGVVVYPMANVDQEVMVSAGALLNNSVVVSHDSVVGHCAFLAPGVVLSGGVRVGARCFLGAGSVVANWVSIGDDAVIGIGSVITRDVSPAAHVIGNPARTLDHPLDLR